MMQKLLCVWQTFLPPEQSPNRSPEQPAKGTAMHLCGPARAFSNEVSGEAEGRADRLWNNWSGHSADILCIRLRLCGQTGASAAVLLLKVGLDRGASARLEGNDTSGT